MDLYKDLAFGLNQQQTAYLSRDGDRCFMHPWCSNKQALALMLPLHNR